jgi:hypothetical protein
MNEKNSLTDRPEILDIDSWQHFEVNIKFCS